MARAFEPRRLVGGFAVLVLHLLVIAALLSATRWNDQQSEQTREIILNLITPKPPKPVKETLPRKPVAAPKPAPAFVPPATFTPPADNSLPQLNGLNRQLFGCSPDQLASATAEERAACASASLGPRFDPGATDYRDHTDRSKSAVRWARGRARKNQPMLLPCVSPQGFNPFGTLLCLGKAAMDGKFDNDMQPGYGDTAGLHPNEGDTRMAPTPH